MKLIIGKRYFCPGLFTSFIALLFFCLFVFLGFWQLDRAEQKRVLFADFEKRQSSPVLKLDYTNISQFEKEDLLWRPIEANGEFLEQYQILLDNQVEQGQAGYFVYTPFKLEQSNSVVLINRGWVSTTNDRQSSPELINTSGPVAITGVIKGEPKTGMLLKDSMPEKVTDNVYRVQKINLKELQDLTRTKLAPYIIRLSPGSKYGYRREWQPPGSGVSMHMGYAFQWFAFAAVLLVIYLALNIKKTIRDERDE